jgi:chemosensory pili system protein ChpA (sensor histidine kinase/response regulator)
MSVDKEQEIRLQFLEEAQEYLDTIESGLIGLSSGGVDGQTIDKVLRAAHSIKGGAAMMGFMTLSDLAHHLEDSFKVLKLKRGSLQVDADLESLLLSASDRLRQVSQVNRRSFDVDPQWLEGQVNPIFEQLHERLGDPQEAEEAQLISEESGQEMQDMVVMLFETEVEGCLQRLENVLATPGQPCLGEELGIMAQELDGLGAMLQLTSFSSLCQSVTHLLSAAPDRAEEIARQALQTWRRTQALVQVGQMEAIPSQLEGLSGLESPAIAPAGLTDLFDLPADIPAETFVPEPAVTAADESMLWDVLGDVDLSADALGAIEIPPDLAQASLTDLFGSPDIPAAPSPGLANPATETAASSLDISQDPSQMSGDNFLSGLETPPESAQDALSDEPLALEDLFAEVPTLSGLNAITRPPGQEVINPTFAASTPTPEPPSRSTPESAQITPVTPAPPPTSVPEAKIVPAKPAPPPELRAEPITPTPVAEGPENTVRVPVKRLEQLNDLFGELTIERTALNLQISRLRELMRILSRRVNTLDQSNTRLRSAYDKISTQVSTDAPSVSKASLSPALSPGQAAVPSPELTALSTETPQFDILEMDRYSDFHLISQEVMETIVQIQEVTSDIELGLGDTSQTNNDLNRTARQLQTSLTQARMRPLSDVVGRFPRALRDLALQYGKQVELQLIGAGTLIDRSVLEVLSDPLMHLLRNSFDHGIEDTATRRSRGKPDKGTIEIRAATRGNQTIITLSDDGGGINLDKVRARAERMGLDHELLEHASEQDLLELLFEPGFSTADQVTALSGRGVGMDVVRTNIRQIRGDIKIDTKQGQGTTFTLTVPFNLSVVRILLVESKGLPLAIPADAIDEMVLFQSAQVIQTAEKLVLNREGYLVPLYNLGQWLSFKRPHLMADTTSPVISLPSILLITRGTQTVGLIVDRCWGEQEVAVRPVEGTIPLPPGFTGCTILGSGQIVPLADATKLLEWIEGYDQPVSPTLSAALSAGVSKASVSPQLPAAATYPSQRDTVLVVDDSVNVRRFLALTLEKAGYLVEQAKDGQEAIEKLLDAGLQVQAVICDIEMPRLDGFGVLTRLRSSPAHKSLPIAMLTSRSGDKHRQLAINLGASAYFTKPYKEQELLDTLQGMIRQQPMAASF